MKKEFKSPYHALGAQTAALVQLIDAFRNAQENELSIVIEYLKQRNGFYDKPGKVIVRANIADLHDYDEAHFRVPELNHWDITYLFQSNQIGESDKLFLGLTEGNG